MHVRFFELIFLDFGLLGMPVSSIVVTKALNFLNKLIIIHNYMILLPLVPFLIR
jgi:hypothetical protein